MTLLGGPAPIEKRSTDRPSSTVRVNSASRWRWRRRSAVGGRVAVAARREAQQVQRMRGDDLEALVGGDPVRPAAG